ncbi:hypothetical protein TeGR_g147 [Tetraparma gracilis]|uniref:Uncharacterized protein n=1 Tax=Tetraparma gracilis TaxID=2962635 RepID=A0ABQ6MBR2_9STRA|nr:hypothetical protein TeGR_g147 [Tetraparma gracilis]
MKPLSPLFLLLLLSPSASASASASPPSSNSTLSTSLAAGASSAFLAASHASFTRVTSLVGTPAGLVEYEWEELAAFPGLRLECEVTPLPAGSEGVDLSESLGGDAQVVECPGDPLCDRLGETCDADDRAGGRDLGVAESGEPAVNKVDACCSLHDCAKPSGIPNSCAADWELLQCVKDAAVGDEGEQAQSVIEAVFGEDSWFPCTKVEPVDVLQWKCKWVRKRWWWRWTCNIVHSTISRSIWKFGPERYDDVKNEVVGHSCEKAVVAE